LIKGELPVLKNKTNLLVTVIIGVLGAGLSNFIYYFTNHEYRLLIKYFFVKGIETSKNVRTG